MGGALRLVSLSPAMPHARPAARPPGALAAAAVIAILTTACGGDWVEMPSGGRKSTATVRAERRAFDGAPPVVAHKDFGMTCTQCHNEQGIEVPEIGYAPALPHGSTAGMSARSRCRQCHVFARTDTLFVANEFVPLRQDLRAGERLNPEAPPVMPHKAFMRENCAACHTGRAAREEIRTPHPERQRCRQCHVPVVTRSLFEPGAGVEPGS